MSEYPRQTIEVKQYATKHLEADKVVQISVEVVAPGLGIAIDPNWEHVSHGKRLKWATKWGVWHLASGLNGGGAWQKLRAIEYVKAIAPLTDWTQPVDKLPPRVLSIVARVARSMNVRTPAESIAKLVEEHTAAYDAKSLSTTKANR